MANTQLLLTPSTSWRRAGETRRNRAVRPNREITRTMDFVSIIGFRLGGPLPTTVMIWYLYQGFTVRPERRVGQALPLPPANSHGADSFAQAQSTALPPP